MGNRRSPGRSCCCFPLCWFLDNFIWCVLSFRNWIEGDIKYQPVQDDEATIGGDIKYQPVQDDEATIGGDIKYQPVQDDEATIGFYDENGRSRSDKLTKENVALNIRIRKNEKELQKAEKDKSELSTQIRELENQNRNLHLTVEGLKSRLQRATDDMKKIKQEKEDALTRLSEFMGDKLRDNNPAITNLNDPNRPMKLADQFSELYENEWTDAFSDLTDSGTLSEIDATTTLVNILKEIHQLCIKEVNKQLSEMKTNSAIEPSLLKLKESLKLNAVAFILPFTETIMTKEYSDDSLVFRYKDICAPYIQKCILICYYAELQDPPVFISYEAEPGKEFDKQSFREYTKSGTIVDYLVWPALYLHKDGALMSKGVVQPK